MHHNLTNSGLPIPADLFLVKQVKDFLHKALVDIEQDTEESATEAGMSYRRMVHFLHPSELSEINKTWSALNLDPSSRRIEELSYVCEGVIHRASGVSYF